MHSCHLSTSKRTCVHCHGRRIALICFALRHLGKTCRMFRGTKSIRELDFEYLARAPFQSPNVILSHIAEQGNVTHYSSKPPS